MELRVISSQCSDAADGSGGRGACGTGSGAPLRSAPGLALARREEGATGGSAFQSGSAGASPSPCAEARSKGPARREPLTPGVLPLRHWKSVEEWENSAKFQRRAANEFPAGALDEPDGVSRRTLLTMMSAAVAAAAVGGGCERKVAETIVPYVRQPEG